MKSKNLISLSLALLLGMMGQTSLAKTFIYCSEGSPTAFNPQITIDGTSHNATINTVYNRLVEFKYGSTEIIPALAQSWEISPDRLNYTFTLRKGVSFHKTPTFTPTREFNADDVLFSIDRQRLKNHPYHSTGGGAYHYFNGMEMGKLIKGVKKLDSHRVQITLTRSEASFLANLAMGFMSILSAEYAQQLEGQKKREQIDLSPVGTGPFIFQKYVKDTLIRYKRNEGYWGPAPKVSKLVFSITPDPNVRYQKLKAGECHLIIEPAPADLQAMKAETHLKVLQGSGLNVAYLAMNTQRKPFDNLLVRKAINHALNKKSYIEAIYLGNAIPATNPLPPTLWSYNDKIKDYDYNPAKAKKLLAQAGFPQGFTTEIWTLPVTRPYNPNGKKMGEMMQADLARIGIKAKLVTYDWPTYLKKSRSGEHQLIQLGWTGDNGDPDNFLNILLGCANIETGSNVARWCHPQFDKLMAQGKKGLNSQKRTPFYLQAQEIFKREAPWVPIAHSIVFRAMANKVHGYKIDPLGADIFKFVELK